MDINHWVAIGKLENDPISTENNGKKQAHFVLVVNRRVQDASGQWVDQFSNIPCYAFDKRAVAIAENCRAGQEVAVEAYYRSWPLEGGQQKSGHGMMIQNISFGYRPREQKPEQASDNIPM